MKIIVCFISIAIANISTAHTSIKTNGLVRIRSLNSVKVTIDKMKNLLESNGMTIFARINHSAGATGIGLVLRDTELLIFGNPNIGTKLMNCSQEIGIDLPLKALAWKDKNEQVWLSYSNSSYLAKRYDISTCAKIELAKISKVLDKYSSLAVK